MEDMAFKIALERASSRSAILSSLKNSYSSVKNGTSVTKTNSSIGLSTKQLSKRQHGVHDSQGEKLNETERTILSETSMSPGKKKHKLNEDNISSPKLKGSKFVEVVVEMTNDKNEKLKKLLEDSIFTKAIVLENSKTQTELTKNREKKKHARRLRASISNKKLKQGEIIDPMTPPTCSEDLILLHNLWSEYIQDIMKSSQSSSQLQSRLSASELIGAYVQIIEYLNSSVEQSNLSGFVTSVSKNCFYISVPKAPSLSRGSNVGNEIHNSKTSVEPLFKVSRVLKDNCILGVYLPTSTSTHVKTTRGSDINCMSTSSIFTQDISKSKIYLIHGKKYFKYENRK